jgi:hypothetical protein
MSEAMKMCERVKKQETILAIVNAHQEGISRGKIVKLIAEAYGANPEKINQLIQNQIIIDIRCLIRDKKIKSFVKSTGKGKEKLIETFYCIPGKCERTDD